MKAVIQRVLSASVEVESEVVGQIDNGLLVFVGIGNNDNEQDVEFMAKKICELRIFEDKKGKMNLSVQDIRGSVLLISNFTLQGNCRKGRRPGFDSAGEPAVAEQLYEQVVAMVREAGLNVETGRFQAHMHVKSVNDGPVTFILESSSKL